MEETTDIKENANEYAWVKAVIADCVSRVEARAMKSELDFFLGAMSALRNYGLEAESEKLGGRAFLAACGRSVCDPSWEEIKEKRAEGIEWDYDGLSWIPYTDE
tara:strand:+ start:981 stop:1292 length:312 start_codon:yes stop_codon:yes gene_type:complete